MYAKSDANEVGTYIGDTPALATSGIPIEDPTWDRLVEAAERVGVAIPSVIQS
jgi:hypothetical protein